MDFSVSINLSEHALIALLVVPAVLVLALRIAAASTR